MSLVGFAYTYVQIVEVRNLSCIGSLLENKYLVLNLEHKPTYTPRRLLKLC
jgi:hypothetical protein